MCSRARHETIVFRGHTDLSNSTLNHTTKKSATAADATVTLTKAAWDALAARQTALDDEIAAGRIQVTGSGEKVKELFGMFDEFNPRFNVVTP